MWGPIVFIVCWIAINVGVSFWWETRSVQRNLLPRKRRLEVLLKELDG